MLMKRTPLWLLDGSHPQSRQCAACDVRREALFGALDEAALDTLHDDIASPVLAPDEALYRHGERGGALYTIRSGVVRFERITERGDRRIVRLAGRGDLVGQEALLRRPYLGDAVACTPVAVCRLPAELVERLGARRPELLQELMKRWQRALAEAEAWSADLSAGPARRRVLMLLALLDRHADDDGLAWMPRREDMGAMLDMAFETASRVVTALRREGVLSLVPPRHARIDPDRLDEAMQAANA